MELSTDLFAYHEYQYINQNGSNKIDDGVKISPHSRQLENAAPHRYIRVTGDILNFIRKEKDWHLIGEDDYYTEGIGHTYDFFITPPGEDPNRGHFRKQQSA